MAPGIIELHQLLIQLSRRYLTFSLPQNQVAAAATFSTALYVLQRLPSSPAVAFCARHLSRALAVIVLVKAYLCSWDVVLNAGGSLDQVFRFPLDHPLDSAHPARTLPSWIGQQAIEYFAVVILYQIAAQLHVIGRNALRPENLAFSALRKSITVLFWATFLPSAKPNHLPAILLLQFANTSTGSLFYLLQPLGRYPERFVRLLNWAAQLARFAHMLWSLSPWGPEWYPPSLCLLSIFSIGSAIMHLVLFLGFLFGVLTHQGQVPENLQGLVAPPQAVLTGIPELRRKTLDADEEDGLYNEFLSGDGFGDHGDLSDDLWEESDGVNDNEDPDDTDDSEDSDADEGRDGHAISDDEDFDAHDIGEQNDMNTALLAHRVRNHSRTTDSGLGSVHQWFRSSQLERRSDLPHTSNSWWPAPPAVDTDLESDEVNALITEAFSPLDLASPASDTQHEAPSSRSSSSITAATDEALQLAPINESYICPDRTYTRGLRRLVQKSRLALPAAPSRPLIQGSVVPPDPASSSSSNSLEVFVAALNNLQYLNPMVDDVILTRKLRSRAVNEWNWNCIICRDRMRTVILLPCNHLCICEDCRADMAQRGLYRCPLDNRKIEGTMKIFWS
ncbi:uncharacterized protein BJ171DRAFT_577047 [Polychytrium aggregatum]|uniref:uncharacterized protein n=1 Tax=Polychytrium aggregatum TaxID=110093 RepID=UPI0022FE985A|nr:uncharacterized protein BJ171DRAFT_577047 [Polychytrium aggregatum]KAI9209431.1 hypothetical protein BJ171DRAFT_577047 [Polychytrium aggregatum]